MKVSIDVSGIDLWSSGNNVELTLHGVDLDRMMINTICQITGQAEEPQRHIRARVTLETLED